MTELQRTKLKSADETRAMVEASLRSRKRRERRFQAYGVAAIAASVTFVAFFFVTIIAQGHSVDDWVARLEVETSTGNHRPDDLICRFRSSMAMPGSTQAVRLSKSVSIILLRYLLVSMTNERPTVCPDWDVPPPRIKTLTPSSFAAERAASISSARFGTTTPTGSIW